ncbi:MAG: class I SAM-dependent methyltransferase [Polyangiaceae bacterium]
MPTSDPAELRREIMNAMQGAGRLHVAYVGITNHLFDKLSELGSANPEALARAAERDPGYVLRWCDAAFAFELLDLDDTGAFRLSALGAQFRPDAPATLMPFAVGTILGAHMAERASGLMKSGERPGEKVLAEQETVLPWFGAMLEAQFGSFFEEQILRAVPAYADVDERGGLAVDLGCGNGWYLRRLVRRFPHLRGVGLDGFEENVRQARELAQRERLTERLEFRAGDLHHFSIDQEVDLLAMNRALHHVWTDKENVFRILSQHLRVGGWAVIWEPAWPRDRAALRAPGSRPMAFQNLAEHVQGNHFLRPDEIADELERAGFEAEVHLFAEGREAVVAGRKRGS